MHLPRPIRTRRSIRPVLATLVVAAVLTACGGGGQSAPASNPAPNADPEIQLDGLVLRLTPRAKYRIGFTLPQFRDPFWVSVAYGIEDEAQKSGLDVAVKNEAGSYANLGRQISQVDDMVQRGLDAILVAPVDRVGISSALDNAGRAGVKVIGAGNLGNSAAMSVGVTFSHLVVGERIADFLGEKLGGKGNVVMLKGPNGADWATLREKGFKQRLAAKYPGIRILEEASLNPDRASGQSVMEDWIQKHGDRIDGVFSAVSLSAEGAVLALRNAGLNGKVLIGTSALSEATLEMLKAGDIQFCYAEPGQLVGRLAVQYAIRTLEGRELPHTQPAEGGLPLPRKVVYVDQPPYTPENADEFDPFTLDWAPRGFHP